MNVSAPLKREWTLTSEAFDRLLLAFDFERDTAGQKYEILRRKLTEFFSARGSDSPLDDVDDTINRVARRLTEGEHIQDLNAYFYGVARLVWLEEVRFRDREATPLELAPTPIAPDLSELEGQLQLRELRLSCLENCLTHLSANNRTLIVEYYREEKGNKIELRKLQATRLNTTLNGLRLRASRIRSELAKCVQSCVDQSPTDTDRDI